MTTITLAEAADRLGVHYMTAYRYVRLGHLPAEKVDNVWRIDPADLETFGQIAAPAPLPPLAERHRALGAALVAGDEPAAWVVIEQTLPHVDDPEQLHLDLLGPALREIGAGWAAGRVTIAEEHRATAVAARLIGRSGHAFASRGRKRGVAVVGAPAGDAHSLPTAMFGDLLRSRGIEVFDLGASTPAEVFIEAVDRFDQRCCVCITVTVSAALVAAADTATQLRDAWPDLPVLVGGGAVLNERQAMELGSTGWVPDPRDAADLAASAAAAATRSGSVGDK